MSRLMSPIGLTLFSYSWGTKIESQYLVNLIMLYCRSVFPVTWHLLSTLGSTSLSCETSQAKSGTSCNSLAPEVFVQQTAR